MRELPAVVVSCSLAASLVGCAGQPTVDSPTSERIAGSAIVAIADGDMAITMFGDGYLFGPEGSGAMRADDLLTVIGLPLPEPGDREQRTRFGSAVVSNSAIGAPRQFAVSPDGRFALVLATRGNAARDAVSWEDLSPGGRLTLVDLSDPFGRGPRVVATGDVGEGANSIALSPDGRTIAVLDAREDVVRFYTTDGTVLTRSSEATLVGVPGEGATPTSVSFSPRGDLLAVTVVGANSVVFYEVVSSGDAFGLRPFGASTRVGTFPYTGQFTPSGRYFVTTNLGWDRSRDDYLLTAPNTTISMIAVAPLDEESPVHREVSTAGAGQNGEGLAVSPRGDVLAIGNIRRSFLREDDPNFTLGGTIQLIRIDEDAGTLTSGPEIEGPAGPQGLCFDANGSHLLVTDYEEGVVQVWAVDLSGAAPTPRYTGLRVGVGDGAHNVAIIP
jgi:6-phosphogluconolactonase (cycloisomerase 2 family)